MEKIWGRNVYKILINYIVYVYYLHKFRKRTIFRYKSRLIGWLTSFYNSKGLQMIFSDKNIFSHDACFYSATWWRNFIQFEFHKAPNFTKKLQFLGKCWSHRFFEFFSQWSGSKGACGVNKKIPKTLILTFKVIMQPLVHTFLMALFFSFLEHYEFLYNATYPYLAIAR